jgi:addiction module HigA family antidote
MTLQLSGVLYGAGLNWSSLNETGAAEMARAPKRSAERCPTHPGAFLREIVLPAIAVSKVDIAAALGVSRQTLYDILAEKQPVTPSTAVRLGAVFETSPASWLRMQTAYDLWHAEREIDTSKLQPLPKAS